jgi:hypothetical protein
MINYFYKVLQTITSFAHAYYVSKVLFVEGFKTHVQSMIKILLLLLNVIYTKYNYCFCGSQWKLLVM